MRAVERPYPRNGAGHAAVVLGVVAISFVLIPVIGDFVSIPAAIGAVIAGVVGSGRVDRGQATNRCDAVIGGSLGVLALLVNLVVFAALYGAGPA